MTCPFPPLRAARTTAFLLVASLACTPRGRAQEIVDKPGVTPALHCLVVPYADRNGAGGYVGQVRPAWLTAALVQQAIFTPNFLASRPDLPASTGTGSVVDFWHRQWPGVSISGVLEASATVPREAGFYQVQPPETLANAPTENDTFARARILLNRLGYGTGPIFAHAAATNASAFVDAAARNGANAIIFAGVGSTEGSVRTLDGVRVSFQSVGSGAVENYDWLGVTVHEFGHLLGLGDDCYKPFLEGSSPWNVMSDAYGRFPGSLPAWQRHRRDLPRREITFRRGAGGATQLLPIRVGTSAAPEFLMLPNGTITCNGLEEWLMVEHRKSHPSLPGVDTALNGLPAGNPDGGLFMEVFDTRGSQWFNSGVNPLVDSPVFGFPLGADEYTEPLAVRPLAQIKSASGGISAGALFPKSQTLAGAPPAGALLKWERMSANADANVVWEVTATGPEGDALGVRADFQGRSYADEADLLGIWSSGAGFTSPLHGATPEDKGWYYREETGTGPVTGFPKVLRAFSNRTGAFFGMNAFSDHCVAANGEVMVLGLTRDNSAGASPLVNYTLDVTALDGTVLRTLSGIVSEPSGTFHYAQLDLSGQAGKRVRIAARFSAASPFGVAVGEAWFFRKAGRVLADLVADNPAFPVLDPQIPADQPGPDSKVGVTLSRLLEDGVRYDRSLAMVPANLAYGAVRRRFLPVKVPADGALLCGSVGYAATATGVSDGANLQLAIDDGIRQWPLGAGGSPTAGAAGGLETLLSPGRALSVFDQPNVIVGTGLARGAPNWYSGDWMAAGDVNGDGRADLVVCAGHTEEGRVLVSLSTGTGFQPQQVWQEGRHITSDRFVTADINGDGRADLVTYSVDGRVEVALSSSVATTEGPVGFFSPVVNTLTDFARLGDVVLAGDVNGDGRSDLVVCTMIAVTLPPFSARNIGTVRVSLGNANGSISAPALWTAFGPNGAEIPLLGDVTLDGRADLIRLTPDGKGFYRASSGTGFPGFADTPWFTHGSPFDATSILPGNGEVYPGNRRTNGPIFSYNPYNAGGTVPQITVFVRSSSYGDHLPGSTFTLVPQPGAGPVGESTVQINFGFDSAWPLVADFTGDGFDDRLITSLTPQPAAPSLYISPRPTRDYEFASAETNPTTFRPRLNKFVFDLSAFAGKTITPIVSLDAGPNHAHADFICFPELKILGSPQLPGATAHGTLAIARTTSPLGAATARLTWPVDSCYQRLEQSGNLQLWGSWPGTPTTVGSQQVAEFPILSGQQQFWRLRRFDP